MPRLPYLPLLSVELPSLWADPFDGPLCCLRCISCKEQKLQVQTDMVRAFTMEESQRLPALSVYFQYASCAARLSLLLVSSVLIPRPQGSLPFLLQDGHHELQTTLLPHSHPVGQSYFLLGLQKKVPDLGLVGSDAVPKAGVGERRGRRAECRWVLPYLSTQAVCSGPRAGVNPVACW